MTFFKNKDKGMTFTLVILCGLVLIGLLLSTFGNIQYPLMWGDEAETAVFAQRILKYGYPKIHDEKNAMWSMISGNVGRWEKFDAYTGNMWGQYYFAVIGELFARRVQDVYLKTALLRIPFAIVGLIGVLILPLSVLFVFGREKKIGVSLYLIYLVLQLLSVSLILHLREVRSYSLAVFFSSLVVLVFLRHYSAHHFSKFVYVVFLFMALLLLFLTFPPAYLALAMAIGFYVLIDYFVLENQLPSGKPMIGGFLKEKFYLFIPLTASSIIMLLIYRLFGISETTKQAFADMAYGLPTYISYLRRIIVFLFTHNFLMLVLLQKILSFYLTRLLGKKDTAFHWSNFLSYVFIIYTLTIAFTPYLFDRYFIFLQPLVSLIIVVDFMLNLRLINKVSRANNRVNYRLLYCFFTGVVFVVSLVTKIDSLAGHYYEVTRRYYGPVDVTVDYIRGNFVNPSELVIETNLEQTSYVYYLGSQLFCDEITPCIKELPDIIIPRGYMSSDDYRKKIGHYLEWGDYQQVNLAILDYPSNNIPEFSLALRHLYKTPLEQNPDYQVRIYVSNEIISSPQRP